MPRAVMRAVIGTGSSRNGVSCFGRKRILLLIASATVLILLIRAYASNDPVGQSAQPQPPEPLILAETQTIDKGPPSTTTGAASTLIPLPPVPQSERDFVETREVEKPPIQSEAWRTDPNLSNARKQQLLALSLSQRTRPSGQHHQWEDPARLILPASTPQRPGWGRRRAPGVRRVL